MITHAKIRCILPSLLLFALTILQISSFAQQQYPLNIRTVDKDPAFINDSLGLQTQFASRTECIVYVSALPSLLQVKGYVTASIDTVIFDSTFANVVLFIGDRYTWSSINTDSVDASLLEATGWNERSVVGKTMDVGLIKTKQERMLNWLENNGYPFAKIYLDSIRLEPEGVHAILKVNKGPLYRIDSIRLYGDVKISNEFMQRYLDIRDGSIYNKQKLLDVSKRIRELGYVEEERTSDLTMLGTGSVLNLYLKPRKSSQVNLLIGFLPNNDQLSSKKLLITGEANLHLKNALGSGETIGLNWQQLQVQSQRLNIIYQHPFLFDSPVGLDLAADMFKKDSSFLNLNLQLGMRYSVSVDQSARLFLHRYQAIISQGGIRTQQVIATRRLPDIADVGTTNIGLDYEMNRTNYRLNPKKGFETRLIVSAGKKKIKKNNEILELKDPGDPSFDFETLYDTVKLRSYQFRVSGVAAKYFPMGKQGTLKTAVNGGLLLSDNIYRNELFQIGGYKLLRGFDEESQYVSQYGIATLEYRYLIDVNSHFFVFADGGWAKNASRISKYSHTYIGTGIGLTLETRSSLFTIAWAIGQRDDLPFNLRQSKIHFGFVNFF